MEVETSRYGRVSSKQTDDNTKVSVGHWKDTYVILRFGATSLSMSFDVWQQMNSAVQECYEALKLQYPDVREQHDN